MVPAKPKYRTPLLLPIRVVRSAFPAKALESSVYCMKALGINTTSSQGTQPMRARPASVTVTNMASVP